MIGPLEDVIAAAVGTSPNKVRTTLMATAFLLCIVAIGLRLLARAEPLQLGAGRSVIAVLKGIP